MKDQTDSDTILLRFYQVVLCGSVKCEVKLTFKTFINPDE